MSNTKTFFRILSFGAGTKKYIPWYVVFILLSIVFGLMNVTLLVPLLNVIFSQSKPRVLPEPEFNEGLLQYLIDNFNYIFNKILTEYGSLGTLYFVCGLVLVAVLLSNIFRYLSQRMMIMIRTSIVKNLRQNIYEKMTQLDLSFFSGQKKGDLMSVISNDLQSIEDSVVASLQTLFKDPVIIIFYFGILFYYSVSLTLFSLIILPITGLLIAQISKRLKKDSTNSQQILGNMLSIAEETISGVRIIKAFNAQSYVQDKFEQENLKYNKIFKSMIYKRDTASPLTEFIAYSVIVAIILYVGPMLLQEKSDLTPAMFITYIVCFVNILTPAKNISNAFAAIQRGLASGERVFSILDEPQIILESKDAQSKSQFDSKIQFNDVSFAYTKGDDGHVLNKINLTIEKGKMIALVGHSGSGKTTLSDMLPRYYDPSNGSILIDGVDIKRIKLDDLRKLMGVVSQESILFNDTVYNNIAFGTTQSSMEKVIEAAKIANAHNFISELDTESEKVVQEALYNLMKNRTSLVIAHRLSTVQNADLIVVLDKGKIVQTGTHNELINEVGIYKQLNELQKLA
ncbi:MAG: ABC transporter ATP-binding protein [Bacteroidetes bacterium]|nr:ABC transporter ATP-binding protein [Bacteroidota bacterium]